MYRRLITLSVIILMAMCGLIGLGYHSIRIRALGMEGARLGEFAAVAEQIRQDVTRKLDAFMQTEQNRPYTDYQYYYVTENIAPGQQQMPVLRSPLAGRLEYGLAYGNFQIEPDGSIITPNDFLEQQQDIVPVDNELSANALSNRQNIEENLLTVLDGTMPGSFRTNLRSDSQVTSSVQSELSEQALLTQSGKDTLPPSRRGKDYIIESLQSRDQKAQVIEQKRSVVEQNVANQAAQLPLALKEKEEAAQEAIRESATVSAPSVPVMQTEQAADFYDKQRSQSKESQSETVQIRIEPFVPVVVPGDPNVPSIFDGQVFLLRHVQIEDRHFIQGFRLNEKQLIEEIEASTSQFMREGMSFELSQNGRIQEGQDVAYAAVLNFGFGDLVLNLKEIDPEWIGRRISQLRTWYFSIVSVVLLAVTLGLASLWHNARTQLKLAQKKDDFISAVSHELRTPLTSIRMYSEMLEKNWVKSQDKATEYYRNMRQESERLSRLIENVLDFSRIQRGRKKYAFRVGDLNECVAKVVEMMSPHAAQKGFTIRAELGRVEPSAFDGDAVTQIVVNLLDNAIKYARNAEDKTIIVRTGNDDRFVLIEVEDRGPGVPHRQRKKIFEQFYRAGAEATRETTGTGLGLALVKKFAEAHNGFVEIINAKPTGAIFRVALASHT
jgi:signal transduction histidine kinase